MRLEVELLGLGLTWRDIELMLRVLVLILRRSLHLVRHHLSIAELRRHGLIQVIGLISMSIIVIILRRELRKLIRRSNWYN